MVTTGGDPGLVYNTVNALAAAALTTCMGVAMDDIRQGLETMTQDENPGRGNLYSVNGFTVVVDFAHNPEAIGALLNMASAMGGRRKALCFGQAGDRPDNLIRDLARNAWQTGLDQVFVSELAKYHRGREHGEVFAVIRDELIRCGATPQQVEHHNQEIDSLNAALEWADEGDIVIMLALERSAELHDRLKSLSKT